MVIRRWMKGARRADGKRSHPPRGANRRDKDSKAGDCEILAGMKGWCPSAAAKARNRFGLFKRTHFCRTSGRSPCLFPGPRPWTPGFPRLPLNQARGRRVRQTPPKHPRSENGASPSLASRDRGPRNEDQRTDKQPEANEQRRRCRGAFMAGSDANWRGVGVTH